MSTTESETRAAAAAVRLDYLPLNRLDSQHPSWWRSVLGVVGFAGPVAAPSEIPTTATMTPLLGAQTELCEVWRLADPGIRLRHGTAQLGRVRYRYCDDVLFGCLTLKEGEMGADDAAQALLRTAQSAYEDIFAVLDATQHRHLVRIWNYVPAINVLAGGEERYRLFNSARQAAFHKSGRAVMAHNIALEPWEVDAGFILCCQARPLTASLELTYDEK